jgi:hypothetical protein
MVASYARSTPGRDVSFHSTAHTMPLTLPFAEIANDAPGCGYVAADLDVGEVVSSPLLRCQAWKWHAMAPEH